MRNLSRKLTMATIIIGLSGWLLLPAPKLKPTAVAQTVGCPTAPSTPHGLQGEQAIQRLRQEGLYDSLQQAVAATSYELRWEERPALSHLPPAHHAPNPAQRLDAYFTPTGLSLASRPAVWNDSESPARLDGAPQPAGAPEWEAAMRLISYGYGDAQFTVGSAELAAKGNHIDYHRAGTGVTEWYINTAKGLEQGFTLEFTPGSRMIGARLRLTLELTGNLRPELAEEGRAIALVRADGGLGMALRYGDLFAWDARGRALPAQMKVNDGQVWLEVDDTDAVYPVTIDPTFTFKQKLWAFDTSYDGAPGDEYGRSVAVDGNVIVAGAPGYRSDKGAVYISESANYGQSWSFTKLNNPLGTADNLFGWSVAISGNTVVVGAPLKYNEQRGAAYVFVRDNTTWGLAQELVPTVANDRAQFGYSVAISGDTIVVGAPWSAPGAAYIFTRQNGSWRQTSRFSLNSTTSHELFGWSVSISQDIATSFTVAVGAPGSNTYQGSAYVFAGHDATWIRQSTSTGQPKLTAPQGRADDYFGMAVAINGSQILVGAPYADDLFTNQGLAFVFTRNYSSMTWNQIPQTLFARDGQANDRFGRKVAIYGAAALVGAPWCDISGNSDQGAAYNFFFNNSNQSWDPHPTQPKLTAGRAGDHFGRSIALGRVPSLAALTLVVGAPDADISWFPYLVYADRGAAYVWGNWATL